MKRRSVGEVFAGDGALNQILSFLQPVKGDERPHPGPLGLAEKNLVERPEPGLQVGEGVALADFINFRLDGFGVGVSGKAAQHSQQVLQRRLFVVALR